VPCGMTEGAKRLLLSVLGDLEEVMGDAALREALLALWPHAMRLLLSCSDLKGVCCSMSTTSSATRYTGVLSEVYGVREA
jgi:hypothetical protein